MSQVTTICCSICGRDLYRSFGINDDPIKHIEYYALNTKYGEEHLCLMCHKYSRADEFDLKDNTEKFRHRG